MVLFCNLMFINNSDHCQNLIKLIPCHFWPSLKFSLKCRSETSLNRQINKQTSAGKKITSLAKVIKDSSKLLLCFCFWKSHIHENREKFKKWNGIYFSECAQNLVMDKLWGDMDSTTDMITDMLIPKILLYLSRSGSFIKVVNINWKIPW